MARWDVLQSSFPHANYSLHDDFTHQNLSAPNRRDLSTHECATCERISHSPYCRPASTIDTILSASVIRILGGQRRRRREEPDNSIRATRAKDN
ncbi:hypothetical protein CEXT_712801 [Caerostris extrusa]|uniref:Uncharacterized protein n=1 Tax=Caerostris extrusa TaxID=172846 RepID=A0AAV4RSF6_CAEEX|nr:hypothetical protein CEXT_712801 [Caerostris extrusa]